MASVTDQDGLVRFGVAMEASLLKAFDALVQERGGSRSEVLRDLVRKEVTDARVEGSVPAVAALTVVYDHHVRDLTERLTELQHTLGEKVRATMHVHLDHDHCLEVTVLHGVSDELQRVSKQILATRGVKHGGVEIVALPSAHQGAHRHHEHGHTHGHDAEPSPARTRSPGRAKAKAVKRTSR